MKLIDDARIPQAYRGNQLIEACGPIPSPSDLVARLMYLPSKPQAPAEIPFHLRPYEVLSVRHLHVPTPKSLQLATSIDLMMRQGYLQRDPRNKRTWQRVYSRPAIADQVEPLPLTASCIGISGVGKTSAIRRALTQYPQVVKHDCFPGLLGPVRQLLWLYVEVPASGKSADLAEALMRATDLALGTEYFAEHYRVNSRRRGVAMMNDWLSKVACHFPGIVVLDEINNLFKLETLMARLSKGNRPAIHELRVADDEALKMVLNLTNSAAVPLLIGGTPDCLPIFKTRSSTAQRLVSSGFHKFDHFEATTDRHFVDRFLPTLLQYQWFEEPLAMHSDLVALMHQLSGGVTRICIALWLHAHQIAIERQAKGLTLDDFRRAANGPLAPVGPAVAALLSNDPEKLASYRDLLPGFDETWGGF